MNIRYKQVPIDEAAAGMVLAQEVCDRHGGVLLAAGAELTATLLQALRRRGIESVRIEGEAASPEQLAAECERVGRRLDQLFRRPHAGAANVFLREQLTSYRMEQLQ